MYDNHYGNQNTSPSDAQQLAEDDSIIDIRELALILWRRKWVIVNTAVFVIVLAMIVVFQLKPRYTADTLLAIESRKNSVVDLQAVMSGMSTDQAAITTEIDVLKSRRLIGKLVDGQALVNDQEFNGALSTKRSLLSYLNPMTYLPEAWSDAVLGREPDTRTADEIETATRARVIDSVLGRFSVSNPPRSYTLRVSFESLDPKKAARLANALAALYLTDQLEVKFEATQRANEWLNSRVYELREKVRQSERAAQQFRERNQLIQTQAAGLVNEQQLAQLNSQLVTAKTELARIEARQRQIEENVAAGTVEESGLLEVVQSPLIQRLKEQESEVRRNRAELGTRYGPKHPNMINVEAELQDISNKISLEITKIVAGIRGQAEVATIRVQTLEQNLEELKQESFQVSRAQVQMRELDREAEANRLLLETFVTRFKETSSQDGMQQADARIISPADVPTTASYPKKKIILLLVGFMGVGLGVGLAFLLETLDNGFRSTDQLKRELGLRGLGMIPLLPTAKLKNMLPEEYLRDKMTSSFAEAHRNVHASLLFPGGGQAPKTIAVTSSIPTEGKSTFALCLSQIMARSGLKVLLVEADLRRPVLKRRLGLEKITGDLTSFLKGEGGVDMQSLYKDPHTGMHALCASRHDDPQSLFAAEIFRRFMLTAREHYDVIIVDTPPVMAVSDAIVIAKQVDTIVYAVQWEKTAKSAVFSGVKMLREAGAPIAGTVLTQVNLTKHRGYGYGDQGYYYGGKNSYYTN